MSTKSSFLLIPLLLLCFALSPTARAVTPAPDGGYPNGNTAECDNALLSLTTGVHNTAIGFDALVFNKTGSYNTATGSLALFSNTGNFNTADGFEALALNTTGYFNTASGFQALLSNTTGHENVATGFRALYSNTMGFRNTATGSSALGLNTIGNYNTATGESALGSNTSGHDNTATGQDALISNTMGFQNTASGSVALYSNSTGFNNTATGFGALQANTSGRDNTAIGFEALFGNITGSENTAIGARALHNNTEDVSSGYDNTAVGLQALFNNTIGNGNTAFGVGAGYNLTFGNNNIDIGNRGVADESSTMRIGTNQTEFTGGQTRTFIAAIRGVATDNADAVPVVIDSAGQLGTASSSRRFKNEIKPMDEASQAILALKPVIFHYKRDTKGTPQFGLIAEEVTEVNPDLVVRDGDGEIYTVRYEAVNAMLLNEFLKEHRRVQKLEAALEAANSRLKTQEAKIQRVSAQVELIKRAPQQTVSNKSVDPATRGSHLVNHQGGLYDKD